LWRDIRRKTLATEKSCCVLWVERLPGRRELMSFYLGVLRKLTTFVILRSSATKNLSCKEQKGEILDFTALRSSDMPAAASFIEARHVVPL
jgi:hypothetical protein